MRKTLKAARQEPGEPVARLELNRRQRAILGCGILGRLRPSALVCLHYAIAHADFAECTVFLGARTIADRVGLNRSSARLGIAGLLEAGILVVKKARTFTRATVYEINVPKADRVEGSILSGWKAPSSQGGGLHPGRVEGSIPNLIPPAPPRRSRGHSPRAAAEDDAPSPEQAARLSSLRIKARPAARPK